MKKLRVTWYDAPWDTSFSGEQPVKTADVPVDTRIRPLGDETLVFILGSGDRVQLAIPASRLISVVLTDVEAGS